MIDEHFYETKDCITDGAGDKQIDAVYIDNQSSTIYIIQGKWFNEFREHLFCLFFDVGKI